MFLKMPACSTGTSCRGEAILPILAGIACFAFVCSRFWVLESRTCPVKHGIDTESDAEEREDRISQLPDDVISLIISRLSTINAVRTSVLSRRWKHIYTFITEVRFYCFVMACNSRCYDDTKGERLSSSQRKFVQAVDSVLQHHSGSKLMSFELVCCFRGCISDIFRRWMNSVGNLGVEQITLKYCSPNRVLRSNPPVFSFDFLPEASSVKRLCLSGGSFQIANRNALQDLELIDVSLNSEAIECILSNCSSLQSLKLKYCVLPSRLRIYGRDLRLKSLRVSVCSEVAEIDLSALNLISFEFRNFRMVTLFLSYVPLLQNLFIECGGGSVTPYVFGKAAQDLPHLKCMFFKTNACFFEGFEIGGVNKLSNLRHLALLLVYYNKLDLLSLAAILDACPLLHKFHLSMMLPSTFEGEQAGKRVIGCHTQLKEVEFSGFSETKNEYNFILYILKNVVSLERLTIFLNTRSYDVDLGWEKVRCDPMNDAKRCRKIGKQLQGQAISKNAEITIV